MRTEHSVTQEEFADYLGISFQAVSKWETGTTLPDITLLPKLASYFGVRIDELFSVDHEDELERIDIMLQRETMTDQNYSYVKRILNGILQENPEDTGVIKRYARYYHGISYKIGGKVIFPFCPYSNLNKTLWPTLEDFFK